MCTICGDETTGPISRLLQGEQLCDSDFKSTASAAYCRRISSSHIPAAYISDWKWTEELQKMSHLNEGALICKRHCMLPRDAKAVFVCAGKTHKPYSFCINTILGKGSNCQEALISSGKPD